MQAWFDDLRLGIRSLSKVPTLTAVALLSLGLGVGAVATVYTWVDRFILHSLPGVVDVNRVAMLKTQGPNESDWSISYPTYRDWSARNHVFDGLAAKTLQQLGVREPNDQGSERAWSLMVSGNYFDVVGVRALHGRTFQAGDEEGAAQVAVLGHDYWARRFRGDPAMVGRTIVVNGQNFAVVGVLPPKFGGSYVGLSLDLYVPVTTYRAILGGNRLVDRGSMFLEGIARLKPGVTMAAARLDLARVGRELKAIYPDNYNDASVSRVNDQGAPATMKPVFAAQMAITVLVLLIACANVANLLLARAVARQKELGVRAALGAGRGQLMRQLLAECVLLAAGGGFAGLYCAYLGRTAWAALIPAVPFPVAMDFEVTWRVVLFTIAISTATVFIFGLWPALRSSRPDLVGVLKAATTGSRARSGARALLVGFQVALAVVSLVSAGLFIRALDRSTTIDPGFEQPQSLLLVDTDLTIAGLADTAGWETMGRLLEGVRAVPGVAGASIASFVPLGWACCSSADAEVEGYSPKTGESMHETYSRVGDGYFETMGIKVAAGRGFTPADRHGSPDVIVVNETFAARYWPSQDPLGRRVRQFGRWSTVVGVARDGHYRNLTDRPFPLIYRPWAQSFDPSFTIHIRSVGDPMALLPALRQQFAKVNVDIPFLDPRTMRDQMEQSTIGQVIGSRMLALFGGVALLLAGIGLYGVMAYSVGQQTREIGIRVALGAAVGNVTGMVFRQGMGVTAAGAAVGGLLAMGVGRMLRGLLLGVSPVDPLTYGAIALLLGAVAGVACVIPARRAAKVDPMVALKGE